MAKEFKEFDKKYSKLKGKFLEGEGGEDMSELDCWEHMDDLVKTSHAVVRNAVYESEGAEEWQMFRVSLKGFSTGMKLARLTGRWSSLVKWHAHGSTQADLEIVRINNYVDSMKRSGLIDLNGKVIK